VDVAVVYGSSFGDTASVAEAVARSLDALLRRPVALHDVAHVDLPSLRGGGDGASPSGRITQTLWAYL